MAGIRAISGERPVLLVLDDAHHAAPDALALLESFIERLRDCAVGLLLAGARRHPAMDRIVERMGRDLPGTAAFLGPLNELEIAEVVESSFPGYKPAQRARLTRRVLADTAGNPFLAVELIRAVRAGLNLPDSAEAWPSARHTLDDTRPGDLPPSVAAALRLRFRQLSEAAQRTLAAVAVLGGQKPAAALARAAELELPALERALDELEWSRWLSGDTRGYVFATGLAREVVLTDMVTAGQQRRMQERARAPVGKSLTPDP
jgi:predicted ATPase